METRPAAPADPAHRLEDDTVKLVAFTIVSVRRGAERTMPGPLGAGTIVVTDNMTGEGFVLWMIDRYLQALSPGEHTAVQPDLKYLRVDWAVTRRWPREPLEFERRQLETLEEIRDVVES